MYSELLCACLFKEFSKAVRSLKLCCYFVLGNKDVHSLISLILPLWLNAYSWQAVFPYLAFDSWCSHWIYLGTWVVYFICILRSRMFFYIEKCCLIWVTLWWIVNNSSTFQKKSYKIHVATFLWQWSLTIKQVVWRIHNKKEIIIRGKSLWSWVQG